jgi:hypothetical protein
VSCHRTSPLGSVRSSDPTSHSISCITVANPPDGHHEQPPIDGQADPAVNSE